MLLCMQAYSSELIPVWSQALSNTVWAFSKLECLDEALFSDALAHILLRLPHFNSQNVANTVRPFLPLCMLAVLAHVAILASHRVSGQRLHPAPYLACRLAPEDMRQTVLQVWGFANLGFNPGQQLWDAVARTTMHSIASFSPQNISNGACLPSFPHAHVEEGALLHAVRYIAGLHCNRAAAAVSGTASLCYADFLQVSPQHEALTPAALNFVPCPAVMWSFAKLNQRNEALLEAAAAHAARTMASFQPQSVVRLFVAPEAAPGHPALPACLWLWGLP